MFFLIPKNVTSERPIALMPTLIRWWVAVRAPEVAKWQQRCRIEWDATDGRNGGAQRTIWEILVEMERFKYRAREEVLGAVALVLDLAKALERVSPLWCGPGRHTSASQGRSCGCFVGFSSTRAECTSKDVWRSRSRLSRLSCQGRSGVDCFYGSCCRMH